MSKGTLHSPRAAVKTTTNSSTPLSVRTLLAPFDGDSVVGVDNLCDLLGPFAASSAPTWHCCVRSLEATLLAPSRAFAMNKPENLSLQLETTAAASEVGNLLSLTCLNKKHKIRCLVV